MDTVDQLKLFMEANSVAIIGATSQIGPGSFNILENLLDYGYSGEIYPVNPNASEILGRKVYPSVKDITGQVDLAVISTSRALVFRLVNDCVEKGIKAIVIVGQGFGDADETGKELQAKIVAAARAGGARIIGPNTFGIANAFNNLSTSYAVWRMARIPVGVICQTGMLFSGTPGQLLVGKCIDIGDGSDVDFSDALEYFENDPDVKLVCLHVEGIRNGRRFMEVAKRVARKKPILALKTGDSIEGARAATTHTGSIVGNSEIYRAAFRQCGVIRVADCDELEDLAKAFLRLPLMAGRGLGIGTVSGGAGIMAVDAAARYNLTVAKLSSETIASIRKTYPANWTWQPLSNPVDIIPAAFSSGRPGFLHKVRAIVKAILGDKSVDGLIFLTSALPDLPGVFDLWQSLTDLDKLYVGKPVVCCLYATDEARKVANECEENTSTVVYPTAERAVRALSRLAEYREFLYGEDESGVFI